MRTGVAPAGLGAVPLGLVSSGRDPLVVSFTGAGRKAAPERAVMPACGRYVGEVGGTAHGVDSTASSEGPLRGAAVLLCLSVVPEADVGDVSRETSLCGAVCPDGTGVAYDGAATRCGSDTAVSPCWWARVGEWLPSLSCAARSHSFAPVSAPHMPSPLPGWLRAIVTPSAASVASASGRPLPPSRPDCS